MLSEDDLKKIEGLLKTNRVQVKQDLVKGIVAQMRVELHSLVTHDKTISELVTSKNKMNDILKCVISAANVDDKKTVTKIELGDNIDAIR